MNAENIVADLVKLNGGELVSCMRLQKQTYLLDRCGAELGLEYTYHYYGPYSFELADGSDYARAEGWIDIEEKLGRHSVPYAIFKTGNYDATPENLGSLSAERARDLLEKMQEVSDIVVELAATIVFLRDEWDYFGKPEERSGISAIEETRVRKPHKATDKRINQAIDLLRDLNLYTEAAPA